MRTIQTLLLWVGLSLALPSIAQWQWRDQHDKMVFSDRPPPADVPDAKVVRRPSEPLRPVAKPASASASAPATVTTPTGEALPKSSGKDKELEERRRQAEEQEAAKKAAQAQLESRARAENCARARQAKTAFDSGVRIARTDANGEREFLDDATRASESRRLQGIITSDCR